MSNGSIYNWNELQEAEAQALKRGEFQGAVMQGLKDLDERLTRMEKSNDFKDLIQLAVAGIIGGIAGIFGGNLK
ncbi:hypothetical protein M0R04_14200 [Candidatus Dojkabacteria bacterium]|jgi:hypothetical protein|nr:hypothetical protein [Candidatus Dojkabacteria bacterium]